MRGTGCRCRRGRDHRARRHPQHNRRSSCMRMRRSTPSRMRAKLSDIDGVAAVETPSRSPISRHQADLGRRHFGRRLLVHAACRHAAAASRPASQDRADHPCRERRVDDRQIAALEQRTASMASSRHSASYGPPSMFPVPVLRYMKTHGITHEQIAWSPWCSASGRQKRSAPTMKKPICRRGRTQLENDTRSASCNAARRRHGGGAYPHLGRPCQGFRTSRVPISAPAGSVGRRWSARWNVRFVACLPHGRPAGFPGSQYHPKRMSII